MKIHFTHPFSLEKNFGKELNETFAIIPEGDWVCVMDWDCMILASDQVQVIYDYVNQNSEAGMLIARSNRSGSLGQRINGHFSMADEMVMQHERAMKFLKEPIRVTVSNEKISGFLMLISKKTWNEIKFSEDLKILEVDRTYARALLGAGKQILIMDSIYVWHSYRIWKPVKDISHLL